MRKLIHIPMVHEAEQTVFRNTSDQLKKLSIANLWQKIEKETEDLGLSGQRVKLFIDGVAKGNEHVALMPTQPGTVLRIARNLVARGAVLLGVEDPDLIREQTFLLRLGNACENNSFEVDQLEGPAYYERMIGIMSEIRNCVRKRDKTMARRINNYLLPEETGILFLGHQHDILPYLAEDIKVENLSPETMELHEQVQRDHFHNKSYEGVIEKYTRLRDQFTPQGRGPERI